MRILLAFFLLAFFAFGCTKENLNQTNDRQVSINDCSGLFKGNTLEWTKSNFSTSTTTNGTDPHHTIDATYIGKDKVRLQVNTAAPVTTKIFELTLKTKNETAIGESATGVYEFVSGNPDVLNGQTAKTYNVATFTITKAPGINMASLSMGSVNAIGNPIQQYEQYFGAGSK